MRREATPIPDLGFFTRFLLWRHFLLRFARVWCIVGCKKAGEYASQVSNELSVRVMVRQKDIVSEAFIEEITAVYTAHSYCRASHPQLYSELTVI